MGCGASVARPVTPEEFKEICDIGAREMEILCVQRAMGKAEEVKVPAPNCVDKHKANAEKLRAAAEAAREKMTDLLDNDLASGLLDSAQNLVGGSKGGLLGKMFGMASMAAGMADKATELTGQAAGAAVGGALEGLAKALDAAIAAIEKPFTEVGKDIVSNKYNEILQVYADFINNYKFADSRALCRGAEPYGPDEYAACAGDAISASLCAASVQDLAKLLLPIVQSEIDKHAVTKAWDLVIETTNKAYDFIRQYAVLEQFGLEKTDLDINIHIVTNTILGLGDLMGKEEAEIRKNPANLSRAPETFAAVFSGIQLNENHYKNRMK